MAIFTMSGNYYPPHGEFKLIWIGKFARRTWVNFTQQHGKNRQRCQQNTFYYAVWQLLLYFYREFPSKSLSMQKRPEWARSHGRVILFHDNAPCHTTKVVQKNHKCTWIESGTAPAVLTRPGPVWLLLVCINVARIGWATLQNFRGSRKLAPGMVFIATGEIFLEGHPHIAREVGKCKESDGKYFG